MTFSDVHPLALSSDAIQANPAHESKVIGASRCNDIVDGVIEDSNRTF